MTVPPKKLLLGLVLLLGVLWLAVRWLPRPPLIIRQPAAVPVVPKPAHTTAPKHVLLVRRPVTR